MEPAGRRFETGTLPYELLGGLLAAFGYLDSLGGAAGLAAGNGSSANGCWPGCRAAPGCTAAPRWPAGFRPSCSTSPEFPPQRVSTELAGLGFGVWSGGNYYAPGLHDRIAWGEALRIGLAHYNTLDEIDRFNEALTSVVAAHGGALARATDGPP